MKRNFLCMLLSFVLVFCSVVPAFATNDNRLETLTPIYTSNIEALIPPNTSPEIVAEIEALKAAEMASIYEQLSEQDSLDMLSEYEALITIDIVNSILRKHNLLCAGQNVIQSAPTYNFPNGGSVQNVTVSGRYAVITYYDFDDSYYYILDSLSFTIADLVTAILGFNPYTGTIFSAVALLRTISTSTALGRVQEADGYAKVTNLRHPQTGDPSSVLTGWYDYPYGSTYAYNNDPSTLSYRAFPVHNPFEDD